MSTNHETKTSAFGFFKSKKKLFFEKIRITQFKRCGALFKGTEVFCNAVGYH